MIQYIIGAHSNESLITKYTKCHKQDDVMCLTFPENHGKTSLDSFIFWPLKSFLIEIRLTAVGGEEMDFPESKNSKSLCLKLGL